MIQDAELNAIRPSEVAAGWPWQVCCPVCGDEYTHHGAVMTFEREPRGEDGPTVKLIPGQESRELVRFNPSPRRSAVRIEFEGECGHAWTMDIIQHKGNTFIRIELTSDTLRTMPYQEYLRTSHWQEVRFRALATTGMRCQLCNSDQRLNVHHRTYERRGCEEPSDVTVLCHACHGRFHVVQNGRATVHVK